MNPYPFNSEEDRDLEETIRQLHLHIDRLNKKAQSKRKLSGVESLILHELKLELIFASSAFAYGELINDDPEYQEAFKLHLSRHINTISSLPKASLLDEIASNLKTIDSLRLENKYLKSIANPLIEIFQNESFRGLDHASQIAKGKTGKFKRHLENQEVALKILTEMKDQKGELVPTDFKEFTKRMIHTNASATTIRNYFKSITGFKTTR